MHILSRGNDSETLRYLKQFTQWMEDTEGFAFERMDDGFHFVKGAGEDREVMPGSDLRSLPAKAFFRSFLERWPKDVTAEQILWVLEPSQPLRSYLEEQLNSDPGHLSSGLLPGTFLVSLEECEIALTHALRLGSVTSWGRPFDPDRPGHIRLHEGIPPSAFLGTPLLDWISDELGTRGHDQCVGGWFFPAPPIFTGVQFERDEIEALREDLITNKRKAFVDRFAPEFRAEMDVAWSAGGRPAVPLSPDDDYLAGPHTPGLGAAELGRSNPALSRADIARTVRNAAEQEFCRTIAKDGVAVGDWVPREAAFATLITSHPDLSQNHFRKVIWASHAPSQWKAPGRPPTSPKR